jgi:hypothetical protein
MKPGKSMQELSEWDELKTFLDPRLIKALGHPVREHILAVFNERTASGREIGEEIGADVSSFYHHIEELEKLECIERVETRKRRGANEHFFKAKRTVFFDEEAWQSLPGSIRADVAASSLQYLFDDVVEALEAGTFDARPDRHLSWAPGTFDARGWGDATKLLDATLDRLGTIREESAKRLAESNEKGVPATMALLAFETTGSPGSSATNGKADRPGKGPRPTSAQ